MDSQDKSLTTLLFKDGFPGKKIISPNAKYFWLVLDEWKSSSDFQQYLSDLCSFSVDRLGENLFVIAQQLSGTFVI